MRMLRMLSGLAARTVGWCGKKPSAHREIEGYAGAAEALLGMTEVNVMKESLGDCYHDDVAYSLGYRTSDGVIELCGETYTNLNTGIDGGAMAALRRHRQNFDPSRDIERFIVALKPVRVVAGVVGAPYGLDPGPLTGKPPVSEVWGEHVASGRFVRQAVEQVKLDCKRRGIDISKCMLTVSVRPHDGQDAFERCSRTVP